VSRAQLYARRVVTSAAGTLVLRVPSTSIRRVFDITGEAGPFDLDQGPWSLPRCGLGGQRAAAVTAAAASRTSCGVIRSKVGWGCWSGESPGSQMVPCQIAR
jgi:hypothetical protein